MQGRSRFDDVPPACAADAVSRRKLDVRAHAFASVLGKRRRPRPRRGVSARVRISAFDPGRYRRMIPPPAVHHCISDRLVRHAFRRTRGRIRTETRPCLSGSPLAGWGDSLSDSGSQTPGLQAPLSPMPLPASPSGCGCSLPIYFAALALGLKTTSDIRLRLKLRVGRLMNTAHITAHSWGSEEKIILCL